VLFDTIDGDLDIGEYAVFGNGYLIRTKAKDEAHIEVVKEQPVGLKLVKIISDKLAYYNEFRSASGKTYRRRDTFEWQRVYRHISNARFPIRTEEVDTIPEFPEDKIDPPEHHSIGFVAGVTTGVIPGVSSFSFNVTVDASANILVLAESHFSSGTDRTITSATYNGVALTYDHTDMNNGGDNNRSAIYHLMSPPTGVSHALVITYSGTISQGAAIALTYSGVKVSAIDGTNGTNGVGTAPSYTITTVAYGCWVISAVSVDSIVSTCGNYQRYNTPKTFGASDTNGPKTPAGNQTMSWTQQSSSPWAISVLSLAPSNITYIETGLTQVNLAIITEADHAINYEDTKLILMKEIDGNITSKQIYSELRTQVVLELDGEHEYYKFISVANLNLILEIDGSSSYIKYVNVTNLILIKELDGNISLNGFYNETAKLILIKEIDSESDQLPTGTTILTAYAETIKSQNDSVFDTWHNLHIGISPAVYQTTDPLEIWGATSSSTPPWLSITRLFASFDTSGFVGLNVTSALLTITGDGVGAGTFSLAIYNASGMSWSGVTYTPISNQISSGSWVYNGANNFTISSIVQNGITYLAMLFVADASDSAPAAFIYARAHALVTLTIHTHVPVTYDESAKEQVNLAITGSLDYLKLIERVIQIILEKDGIISYILYRELSKLALLLAVSGEYDHEPTYYNEVGKLQVVLAIITKFDLTFEVYIQLILAITGEYDKVSRLTNSYSGGVNLLPIKHLPVYGQTNKKWPKDIDLY
jgi:hypothetical protein